MPGMTAVNSGGGDAAFRRQRGGFEKPGESGEVEAERGDVDGVRPPGVLAEVPLSAGQVRERRRVLAEGAGVSGVHDHGLRAPDVPRVPEDAAGQHAATGGLHARDLCAYLLFGPVRQLDERAAGERAEQPRKAQDLVCRRVVGDAHDRQRSGRDGRGRRGRSRRAGREHRRRALRLAPVPGRHLVPTLEQHPPSLLPIAPARSRSPAPWSCLPSASDRRAPAFSTSRQRGTTAATRPARTHEGGPGPMAPAPPAGSTSDTGPAHSGGTSRKA